MKQVNGFTFKQWLETAGFELDSSRMWPEDLDVLRDEWRSGVDPFSYTTAKPRPSEDPEDTEEIAWFWSNAEERVATPFDVSLVGKVGLQTDIERKYKLLPGGKWVMVFE